jgi:putative transposase
MPRRQRQSTAGMIFHVLNRSAQKATLFENHRDYEAFECVLIEGLGRFGVALFAYCLMPTHWHLLIMPTADGAMSRFMHWLTTTHARRWQTAKHAAGHGAVYQGRFKAIPISCDEHFLWVGRYVERNALRASLATAAEQWRWSSLWRRENQDSEWLAEWPIPRPHDWLAHVNRPQTEAELTAFRRSVLSGVPYGPEDWAKDVRARFGERQKHTRGRPRRQNQVSSKNDPRPLFIG